MTGEMAGGRSVVGVAAGSPGGAGVSGLLGLLLVMEAGVPVPVPSDLVMLLLGERVSAGALPLWLAAAALELVALAGTAALFLAARGPGRALLRRVGARRTAPTPGRDPNREGGRGREGPRAAVHRVLGRVRDDPDGRAPARPAWPSAWRWARVVPNRPGPPPGPPVGVVHSKREAPGQRAAGRFLSGWTALDVQAGVARGL
jgi:hypothetical protein